MARDGAARRADHILGHAGVAARVVQVGPAREAGLLPRDEPRVAAGAVAPRAGAGDERPGRAEELGGCGGVRPVQEASCAAVQG